MEFSPDAKRAFHVQTYGAALTIDGVRVVELARHADDGGAMTELAPGAIKAFHLHARQTDVWFVPPSDRMLVVLLDVRKGSRSENLRQRVVLGHGASRLLVIPPGVAHGVRNLGEATGRIVYLTDLHFSAEPATCDEGRLPWDFAGKDVWEIARG